MSILVYFGSCELIEIFKQFFWHGTFLQSTADLQSLQNSRHVWSVNKINTRQYSEVTDANVNNA